LRFPPLKAAEGAVVEIVSVAVAAPLPVATVVKEHELRKGRPVHANATLVGNVLPVPVGATLNM
jgi:hypothetical protein